MIVRRLARPLLASVFVAAGIDARIKVDIDGQKVEIAEVRP